DDELILVWKNQFNILLRHLDAVACRWMRAEHLRHASRPRAFLRLELFEEAHGSARIVSRLVEILQSEIIGFRFVFPRELQELHRNEESGRLAECESADAAHADQRNRSEIHEFGLGRLLRSMTSSDMRDFICHHGS